MTGQPRLIWDVRAQLGEGPVWDARDSALWFTDIKCRKICRYDPGSGQRRTWDSPEKVGFLAPAQSGGFVAGLQSGLHRFDPQSGAFELLVQVEPDKPGNRLNDCVVDAEGRLWFGTMDDNDSDRSTTGAFYCYDRGELRTAGIGDICITNGPAVSPDGGTLYWVDTVAGTISAADLRGDGTLGPSRPMIRIHPSDGSPDGPTVDSSGCIWIALYGGWEARRYSPAGELLDRVPFPVGNVTKLALGGGDLRSAFATSARQYLDPKALEEQPDAGGLFEFRVEVPGVPAAAVALD